MILCAIALACAMGCDCEPPNLLTHAVASWYGKDFNGRTTACGEIYNMNEMSCAHRTLPMGTILMVYYKGRSIEVIVNDRGPYVEGRDLDLSRGAFKLLVGDGGQGLADVRYELLGRNIRPTMRYNL